ncbi:GIY-YIG nuclease family protein [Rarobacter faecitabidus]|uniref:GIY-YIG catalytic domain-containing protein n=1 Tax=Rarobacter faecitabidus TaxID=13243 RepID=A0A542ZPA1_RARFA|nr:GIY-YIG nuclease family protein [Rarobacter faecitabidus]TQL62040.1 hypothetical protein FB461_1673 [Rarobacter faecitabidus]
MTSAIDGEYVLTFGDILGAVGLRPEEVLVVRHTYSATGLTGPTDLTPERLLRYTREQSLVNKVPATPPPWWFVFLGEAGLRSRLIAVYRNAGEVLEERTDRLRYFALTEAHTARSLKDRLVIRWSPDPVNWAKLGTAAASFPVLEIADRERVPFPGYDNVLITFPDLKQIINDSRYVDWQVALSAVQGIYLISHMGTGQLYVGKADGQERIWARWAAYARTGHGYNAAMRDAAGLDPAHPEQYQFSLLRVFGPHVPQAEVDMAEVHFKRALLTRQFGLNRN